MIFRLTLSRLAIVGLTSVIGSSGIMPFTGEGLWRELAPAIAQKVDTNQSYNEALDLFRQGEYEPALAILQELLNADIVIGDRSNVLYYLGRSYHALGSYSNAINRYELALDIWESLAPDYADANDIVGLNNILFNQALVLTGIGRSQRALGEYESARAQYDQALQIHTDLGSVKERAVVLDEIAKLLRNQGEYTTSLQLHEQALQIIGETDDIAAARIHNSIGVTYYTLDNYSQALSYYETALALGSNDRITLITSLINIASVHVTQGALATAESYYRQVLELRSQGVANSANPVREAALARNIGGLYARQQRYEEALETYNLALQLYAQQNNPTQQALVYASIGQVLTNLQDYEQAEASYLAALNLYEEIGEVAGKGNVLADLGRLYDQLGNATQARLYYQRAVDEVFESALANIQSSQLKANFANQHAAVYRRLVELIWESGDYALAFDYVERSRARAFLDQIANGTLQFRSDATGQLLEQEQALSAELIQLQDNLNRLQSIGAELTDIEAAKSTLQSRQQDYLALLERLQRQSPEASDLTTVEPASLSTIQSLLDPQTTLLEYFILEDRVLAFVITRDSFHAEALAVEQTALVEAVRSFYEYDIAVPKVHPTSLQRLNTVLLKPLQRHLQTEKLIIAPHNILHYVPFAALTDGQQYLVDQHQLTQVPSANVLRFLQQPTQNSGKPIVFGNPTADLPFAAIEASAIASLYDVQPVIGKAATESQLRSQATQASILHLATHGEYNVNNPLFSQILFADSAINDDGKLQVHEIYELDLTQSTRLVVLSACQTQVGAASDGDEIIGLNRAFLYAGTPNVIATLWPISDEATAQLMEQFYSFLREGLTTAEALQRAQQEIRKIYPHPYYWAAFGLTGNGF